MNEMLQQIFEFMKEYTIITKEQYSQYMNLQKDYDEQVAEGLKKSHRVLMLKEKHRDKILDLLFRRDRMGSDTRKEQTNLKGRYCGFGQIQLEFLLKEMSFTQEELIDYINAQWDIKELEDNKEEEIDEN